MLVLSVKLQQKLLLDLIDEAIQNKVSACYTSGITSVGVGKIGPFSWVPVQEMAKKMRDVTEKGVV